MRNADVHDLAQVLTDELEQIELARAAQDIRIPPGTGRTQGQPSSGLDSTLLRSEALGITGLALSGGGIRSATFSLGVIQALCEAGMLRHFDYLSTVSGGGYIGSWLSAQMYHRHPEGAVANLESQLSPNVSPGAAPKANEDASISFLREYSNYLTPKVGLLSTDTLAAIAAYVRNLTLIQAIFISLLVFVLLLPRLLFFLARLVPHALLSLSMPGIVGVVLLAASVVGIVRNLGATPKSPCAATRFVLTCVILPGVLAAFLFAIEMANLDGFVARWGVLGWIVFMAVVYSIAAAAFPACNLSYGAAGQAGKNAGIPLPKRAFVVFVGALAGAAGGTVLFLIRDAIDGMATAGAPDQPLWFAVSIAPFLVLQAFALTIVLHLGLVGRIFDYDVQEWWARYGAWLLAVTLGVGGICAAGIYGAAIVLYGGAWLTYAGGPGWLAVTLWGVLGGASKKTSGTRGSWRDSALVIAPYVFIIGLVVILSYVIYMLYPATGDAFFPSGAGGFAHAQRAAHEPRFAQMLAAVSERLSHQADYSTTLLSMPVNAVLIALVAFAAAACVLTWRVDINLFSLYNFYRNRLTRCYLGASRVAIQERHPHPFTGFDIDDDIPLDQFAGNAKRPFAQRPYHIINTALNMTSGENLAWQQRKAAAFFFSPLYCGFHLPRAKESGEREGGFIKTKQYMRGNHRFGPLRDFGPMLGGAVAVSGAAVSPNSGFHTDPGVAFLMTLFNVRLGRWCPNPASPTMRNRSSPGFGGALYLNELFGAADSDSPYVYLSDGGHFDNLGIYELVRRRARLIVLCDCGEDAPLQFDDLADTIRKCSSDFGVDIVIDVDPLRREPGDIPPPCSGRHVVKGKIRYPSLAGSDPKAAPFEGTLILIKPTLTKDIYACASDLRNYALAEPAFPQQSTADQWFNEAQFESYRKLGYLIGRNLIENPFEDESTFASFLK